MAIPEPSPGKAQLRKHMRQLLCGLDPAADKANAALGQWLRDRPALRTIALYHPLPREVDFTSTHRQLSDFTWVYPKVSGNELSFHAINDLATELSAGAFGILEPADGLPTVPIGAIDAFICPGLAFDPRGGRLGRGRGFYDRMLAQARPDALKVGACYEPQYVEDTHAEAHDVHMDHVIVG